MKNTIKKELHSKSMAELRKQLVDAKEQSRVLRLDHEQGKIKNTSSLAGKRAEIAVISTIINEKLLEEKLAKAMEIASAEKVLVKEKKTVKAGGKKDKPASAKAIAGKGGKDE